MKAESTKESLGLEQKGSWSKASVMGDVCATTNQILLSVCLKNIQLQITFSNYRNQSHYFLVSCHCNDQQVWIELLFQSCLLHFANPLWKAWWKCQWRLIGKLPSVISETIWNSAIEIALSVFHWLLEMPVSSRYRKGWFSFSHSLKNEWETLQWSLNFWCCLCLKAFCSWLCVTGPAHLSYILSDWKQFRTFTTLQRWLVQKVAMKC